MQDQDKKQLWKIIARAVCPKRTHNCESCLLRCNCVRRAKNAADNIKAAFMITPKTDHSLHKAADLKDIPKAEVVEDSS